MTAHDLELSRSLVSQRKEASHDLRALNVQRLARQMVVFTPHGRTVDAILQRASKAIPGAAGSDVVFAALSHNPDSLWAIAHRDRYDPKAPVAEGLVAYLMLNAAGLKALATGRFNGGAPDFSLLARQNEKPAGIYAWAMYAPGRIAAGIPLTIEKISSPLYADVDLFTRAATDKGRRFVEKLGFCLGATIEGHFLPTLYQYRRSAVAMERPTYDDWTEAACGRSLSVKVARTLDDFLRVASVRSAVYIAEQDCPFAEEFDGNDFAGTHLIGYVGKEPAGCLRIRYFANFAKMERLAVRHEFRNSRLAFRIARAGIVLCRKKGYRFIYGHARKELTNFWQRFGFAPLKDRPEFGFSGQRYVEMLLQTEPDADALSLCLDPYVSIRPEGQWERPGILEQWAQMGARP